eukprot:14785-Heterococcus_DN1.PRE.2
MLLAQARRLVRPRLASLHWSYARCLSNTNLHVDEEEDALVDLLLGNLSPEERTGRVLECSSGIAVINGLCEAKLGDLLDIHSPNSPTLQAVVLQLDRDRLRAAVLGRSGVGAAPRSVAELSTQGVRLPVNPVGAVLNALGQRIEALTPPAEAVDEVETEQHTQLTRLSLGPCRSPPAIARAHFSEQLCTGISIIDALHPLARGQSFALAAGAGTGCSTLALQIVANQGRLTGSPLRCVYVIIGGTELAARRAIAALNAAGALAYTTVVAAPADTQSAGMQLLAPHYGLALAQQWRDAGKHALIVYDDLSSHSAAAADLARHCYGLSLAPTSLHGPLLEGAAQLSAARGGGSLTAIALSASQQVQGLTDAAIELSPALARTGSFPAVDCRTAAAGGGPGMAVLRPPLKGIVRLLTRTVGEAAAVKESAAAARALGIDAADDADPAHEALLLFGRAMQPALAAQSAAECVTARQLLVAAVALLEGRFTAVLPAAGDATARAAAVTADAVVACRRAVVAAVCDSKQGQELLTKIETLAKIDAGSEVDAVFASFGRANASASAVQREAAALYKDLVDIINAS